MRSLGNANAMRNLVEHIRRGGFVRDTAILTAGTAIAQAIIIIATPVLSRLYTPAEYGMLALFVAILSISSTLITLRYEVVILLPKCEAEAKALVMLVLGLAIAVGSLIALLACMLSDRIRAWGGLHDVHSWLTIAVFMSIGTAGIATCTNWFNRRREYTSIATTRIMQSLIFVIIGTVLGLISVTEGLLYSQAISVSLTLIITSSIAYKSLKPHSRLEPRLLVNVARDYQRAPIFLLPTALLDVVSMQLPVLLITVWFSSDSAGQYSMAWRLLALPGSLVGAAIGQVFFQRLSNTWPDAMASKALLLKTWKMLALFGIVPAIVIMFLGKSLLVWILGTVWHEAGIIAAILAPMVFMSLIHSPTSTAFIVLGMEKLMLYFGVAVLIYRPLCFFVGKYYESLYVGLCLFVTIEICQMLIFQYLTINNINTRLIPNAQNVVKV